jgi:glyoxylase-like metal-dependent hydrolase (beta-lactamase superfamily II)
LRSRDRGAPHGSIAENYLATISGVTQTLAETAWHRRHERRSLEQQRGRREAAARCYENPPPPAPGNASAAPPVPPPQRDLVAEDGQPIAVGGIVITPVSIPGHTPR